MCKYDTSDLGQIIREQEGEDFRRTFGIDENPAKNALILMTPVYGEIFVWRRLRDAGTSVPKRIAGTCTYSVFKNAAYLGPVLGLIELYRYVT